MKPCVRIWISRLLKTKELADQKVLIFTEFADTARYLKRQLDQAGIDGVAQVDSASPGNRADVIQRFSPYYNSLSSTALTGTSRKTRSSTSTSTSSPPTTRSRR